MQGWHYEWAKEAFRIAKPGAYLLAAGGTRTFHRLTVAIEDAGWEIRDCIMWLYGSGFPKSHNISIAIDKEIGGMKHRGKVLVYANHPNIPGTQKDLESPKGIDSHNPITDEAKEWNGYGTALKPSWEPFILARKPFNGSVAKNVLEYGVGGLNIDGCRIGTDGGGTRYNNRDQYGMCKGHDNAGQSTSGETFHGPNTDGGRWPANLMLDEESAQLLDEQSGVSKSRQALMGGLQSGRHGGISDIGTNKVEGLETVRGHDDQGGASRFFYTAKASKSEREMGLASLDEEKVNDGRNTPIDNAYQRGETKRKNIHPTVKPLDLMRYLVRLVTPKNGTVLDPFAGSGTTIIAAMKEGFTSIGIEKESQYVRICKNRIKSMDAEIELDRFKV